MNYLPDLTTGIRSTLLCVDVLPSYAWKSPKSAVFVAYPLMRGKKLKSTGLRTGRKPYAASHGGRRDRCIAASKRQSPTVGKINISSTVDGQDFPKGLFEILPELVAVVVLGAKLGLQCHP